MGPPFYVSKMVGYRQYSVLGTRYSVLSIEVIDSTRYSVLGIEYRGYFPGTLLEY